LSRDEEVFAELHTNSVPALQRRIFFEEYGVKTRQDYRLSLINECFRKEALCARLLRAVAFAAGQAATVSDTLELCLRRICDSTGWALAHARILAQSDALGERLPTDIWHVSAGERSGDLQAAIESHRLPHGSAWHAKIARTSRPLVLSEVTQEPTFAGGDVAREFGLRSALGMRVVVSDKLKAVCEFFSCAAVQGDTLWEEVLASVSAAIAGAIERRWFEQALHELRTKLLNLQDDERRRLARELHDTTGQNISLVIINLDSLEREAQGFAPAVRQRLAESGDLARRSLQEIRTFSYLLHPPLLDELGVIAALRAFVEGFSERSGIHVELDLPEHPVPMPRDLEITILRVVQESLSNVLKHSRSPNAKVHMDFAGGRIAIRVEDDGKGLPSSETGPLPRKIGVGIASMHERVKQCGGELTLTPRDKGTQLQVTLPLPELAHAVGA
jgi:signal transduction histidine kinase